MPAKKRIHLGTFTSTAAGTAFDLSGVGSLARQAVSGATLHLVDTSSFTGTFTLEVSGDGTNYVVAKDAQGDAIAMTGADVELIGTDGIKVRGKCSAYTSGTGDAYLVFA